MVPGEIPGQSPVLRLMKQPPVSRRAVLAAPVILAGMALKPENPVVGGTVLRRYAIESPNYAAGSAGWIIKQDGSAEFNNVTVRGTVTAGHFIGTGEGQEFIIYSGTPAANNVVASVVTAQATDASGNVILAGSTTYGKSGITYYANNQIPGADASGTFGSLVTVYTGASMAAWTAGTQINLAGSDHMSLLADVLNILGITGQPLLQLHSSTGLLSAAAQVKANAQGILNVLDAGGLTGAVPLVQVDMSANSAGNNNTAALITKAWPVGANEGAAGTTYRIKALATLNTGQTTIETLTLGVDIGGTKTALATLGASFNGSALNTAYAIPLELALTVDAVSAGTPEIYLSGPLGDTAANRLATNSANMTGFSHTAAWDKTASNTLAIYAQWGGAGGSAQTCGTIASRLYREGP
jgi:hypothetical protein